jgi:purine-nucleoside/S-methyl-5'-thioadenosine phosphorylase / adenosine deaminase
LIIDGIFDRGVKAFFTDKRIGTDLRRVSEVASVKKEMIYMPVQRHTDRVIFIDSHLEQSIADAVITNSRDVMIGVHAADCVPILVYDRVRYVAGAVHAGWRGTAAGILKKTIRMMMDMFCASPADILIAIGPSIRWCCYAVGYEVHSAIQEVTGEGDYYREKGEVYFLDLSSVNRYQALAMGIRERHIWISGECTCCNPERFYSYRYAGGPTGRQGGFIRIM